ncbi:MAG: hypothetical protein E7302_17625 [Butyrivibrio sp.]|nr:hypothetical protein [Butyrivibrio sp.]
MKKSNVVAFVVGLCMFTIFVILVNGYSDDMLLIALVHSLDLPSLLCVLGIPLMILAASGKVGSFFKAFKKDGSDSSKQECLSAVNCAITGVIVSGFIGGIIYALCFLAYGIDTDLLGDASIICILLPPLYGFIISAILLPIKNRLD